VPAGIPACKLRQLAENIAANETTLNVKPEIEKKFSTSVLPIAALEYYSIPTVRCYEAAHNHWSSAQVRKQSESFAGFIHNARTVLLPGAMGTELQRRGYKSALPLWSAAANLDAPGLVEQIHSDYFAAGADAAITNTFRTTPRAFRKAGRENEAQRALKKSVAIALKAKKNAGRQVFVGGSFAPLEDCYRPDLVPGESELRKEHGPHAAWLAESGVDFLLPETVNACLEGQIMAEAASATGLPFIISFVAGPEGTLLDGTPLAEAVKKTDLPGRIGIALNCRPIATLDAAFRKLLPDYGGVIGLYANGAGHPHGDLGWCFEEHGDGIDKFVASALRWRNAGAKIIGGCCGTTPDYIRALHSKLRNDAAGQRRSHNAVPRRPSSIRPLQDLAYTGRQQG
jgi:S-methylmethionine-dependent homocysteine/selenocysteine methylase